MTSIIPLKPFGKDPRDLEWVVKTPGTTQILPNPCDPADVPRYNFSRVCVQVSNRGDFGLVNLPFNCYQNNEWKQGVWSYIGIPSKRYSPKKLVDCITVQKFNQASVKSTRAVLIPSIPLYAAALGAASYLTIAGVGGAKKLLNHLVYSLAGTLTSSLISWEYDGVITHGLGLPEDHPLYAVFDRGDVSNKTLPSYFAKLLGMHIDDVEMLRKDIPLNPISHGDSQGLCVLHIADNIKSSPDKSTLVHHGSPTVLHRIHPFEFHAQNFKLNRIKNT